MISLKTHFGLLFEWPLKTGFTVIIVQSYISRVGEGSSGVKDRRAGSQTHSINSATSSSSDIPPGRLTQTSSVIT